MAIIPLRKILFLITAENESLSHWRSWGL